MVYRWTVIGVVMLLLVVGFQGELNKAFAQKPDKDWICKVISVQGRVTIKRRGEHGWQAVGLNDALFAGDQIRVEANSRAGIVLSNDAVLRLDQNTTLVFTEIEKETTFIFKLLRGAANFFSRRARSLKIFTPFVNGVVEGTEFYVQVDAEQTRIDLFEGRILAQNPFGELHLVKGQGATAMAGSAPQRRLLVKPRDSVQWALYYPPILATGPGDMPAELKDALDAYHQGRRLKALSDLEQIEQEGRNSGFYTLRAAMLLHQGGISQARNDIAQALALDPENSEAYALQAIIAVVQNRSDDAMKIAQHAVQLNPGSTPAQLALSYAHQARFDLTSALQAAETAVNRTPENGTAMARLAELHLSTGKLDRGLNAARKAVALNPAESHAHTLLGFAYLTQIKIRKARKAFEKAITLDSAAPLPRLGLGLAKIREGALEQGRREIEIAVGLDPVNALMRSYLGKAYFDEKRGPLDETQLEIAKALDINDPTPWFYDAIRKQTLNRPVEALYDLQQSIKLNDNRAVYRSRLLLDEDLAARSASLGRIYKDLGFEALSLRQGWRSLSVDPGNYSAHRLLADSYSSRQRYEVARVSELLQSQLLQPLNTTPLQPQLSESNLQILEGSGPGSASLNEMNPLFISNGLSVYAGGVSGGNETIGDEISLSGLYNKVSLSVGQFHYETEGFRENNDYGEDIYDLFVQTALSPKLNLQGELRRRNTKQGDLSRRFDLTDFNPDRRRAERIYTRRLGMNYSPGGNSTFLASYIKQDSELDTGIVYKGKPYEYNDKFDGYIGEGQYLFVKPSYSVIAGIGRYEINNNFEGMPIAKVTNDSYYLYSKLTYPAQVDWTLGISHNVFDDDLLAEKIEEYNPKFGFAWRPYAGTEIRMAYFSVLKRNLLTDQTIEPTQVAGFNQFYDDYNATFSKKYGIAIDQRVGQNLNLGAEYTIRRLKVPARLSGGDVLKEDWQESLFEAYLYFTFLDAYALSAQYSHEYFDREIRFRYATPEKMNTLKTPVSLSYFSPMGIYVRATGTFVMQEVLTNSNEVNSDSFSIVDYSIGYRFPKRYGDLSLTVMNAFDHNFNYQSIDSIRTAQNQVDQLFYPERIYMVKVNLTF